MKLFINEFIKDYKKKTTWLYLLLLFGIILLNSYFTKRQFEDGIDAVKILSGITVVSAALAMVFSLIMLANNLSQEYSKGTIKFLYTRPKSRSAILTAKIVLAFINYIIFLVVGTVFDFLTKYYVFFNRKVGLNHLNDTIEEGYFGRTVAKQLIITNLADLAVFIFFVAMVVLVCVVFKTQILSLVLVMISLLGGSIISGLTTLIVNKFEWVKYHLFNVPLFQAFYESEDKRYLVKNMYKFDNINGLLIMLVGYTVLFFIVSYVINSRRDITID